ncbi:MAG: M24 family metallopeptidase [Roseiflexaceae bacterium]
MSQHTEWSSKRTRIATLLEQHDLNGILLTRCANISWISCGGQAHVGLNSESAVANILCTRTGDYLIANKIEMPRMLAEVVGDLPLEPREFNWFEPASRDTLVDHLCGAGRWGSDVAGAPYNLSNQLTELRIDLTDAEQQRFREHGLATGHALENAARMVRPGMTEMEIAGVLSAHIYAAGATPVVALIAADDRIQRFRHPAPTNQRVERTAMLVVCARKYGLIVSATRLVAFGGISDDLIRRTEACAAVDAHAWHASQPGRTLGSAFSDIVAAYATYGYADEWHLHHQGGITAYENREIQARLDSTNIIQVGHAFAWNPSITGTKTEDTMILTPTGAESITTTGNWPMIDVPINGTTYQRPGILIR